MVVRNGLKYGRLAWEGLPDNKYFKVTAEFNVLRLGTGKVWSVPKGFLSDGASIPSWARPVIGGKFNPRFIEAAVVHDFHCELGSFIHHPEKYEGVNAELLQVYLDKGGELASQKATHKIFHDLLKAEGLNGLWGTIRRKMMHYAVKAHNRRKNPKWK